MYTQASNRIFHKLLPGAALLSALVAGQAHAATATTLVSFDYDTQGGTPYGSLIADANGNLFGMAYGGGAYVAGTVFEIAKTASGYASTPTVLVNFDNDATGGYPYGDLIADANGNLFGMTPYGRAYGYGTVFELAKTASGYASTPTVLVNFDYGATGGYPYGSLIVDANGNLFGMTHEGGVHGAGTVFELAKTASGYASTPTVLANFDNDATGGYPVGSLIADTNGNLFGMTYEGGAYGYGTVFELAKTASGYASTPTVLVNFDNSATGGSPSGSLIADANGNLFGMTHYGGTHGHGTVFELAKTASGYASTPTVLANFDNGATGGYPYGSLIADANGNLFGMTYEGGDYGYGTVFELAKTASGYASTPTVLVSFDYDTQGGYPYGSLIADANGNLFGMTSYGGAYETGTVFEITDSGFVVSGGPNNPPTADAGPDQAIHAGQTVLLNGSASFDDNTHTASLGFAWTLTQKPAGSTAALSGANTISPTFVADRPGDYKVQLVVTDSNSAASAPDEVLISSNNANPTANAGADQTMVLVGNTVSLSGAASTDADGDPLTYAWTLATNPVGSGATLTTPGAVSTSFVADLPGTYTATLTVSDGYGGSATDSVTISVITGAQFAENEIVIANTLIEDLSHSQVTTAGNQQALQNFLAQAIRALQANNTAKAINKVQKAIARTDGCVLRGAPDGAGPGRDWVTDCQAQGAIYAALTAALDALTP